MTQSIVLIFINISEVEGNEMQGTARKGKIKISCVLLLLILPFFLPTPITSALESNDNIRMSFAPRPNGPPMKPINPNPANESVDVIVPVILSVDVYDDTGHYVDVYFYNASNNALIGVDFNVPSKWSTASVVWDEPIKGQICYWYAIVMDQMYYNKSDTWVFATRPNQPSIIYNNEYPANRTIHIGLNATCQITIGDEDADLMTIYWLENSTGSYVLRQTTSSVPNGTYYWNFQQAIQYSTTYYWMVSVNDTMHNTTAIFYYTTIDNQPVAISNPIPVNQSINISKAISYFYITLDDPEDDNVTWSIETHPDIGNAYGINTSEGQKACPLAHMNYTTNYTIYVNATDSINGTWVNKTFWFVTAEQGAPTISNEYPPNKNTKTEIKPICHVDVFDIEGDNLTIYWYENSTGSWVLRNTDTNITANSTVYWTYSQASSYSTKYFWRVIVNDSTVNVSATYYFTTESAPSSPPGGGSPGGGYTPPPNIYPFAKITGPDKAYINESFILYAYYSNDLDGHIIGYRWDFDNDGNFDTEWLEDLLVLHSYSKIGKYTIRLQVKDDDNAITTASHDIQIIELEKPLELPRPKINAPDFEYIKQNITFSGNASYDPDGIIVNYTWDFGDGNISYLENPIHKYEKPGTYTVILKVTDNTNLTNVTSLKIIIIEKEKKPDVRDLPFTILLTILIAIIVTLIITLLLTKRYRNKKQKEVEKIQSDTYYFRYKYYYK